MKGGHREHLHPENIIHTITVRRKHIGDIDQRRDYLYIFQFRRIPAMIHSRRINYFQSHTIQSRMLISIRKIRGITQLIIHQAVFQIGQLLFQIDCILIQVPHIRLRIHTFVCKFHLQRRLSHILPVSVHLYRIKQFKTHFRFRDNGYIFRFRTRPGKPEFIRNRQRITCIPVIHRLINLHPIPPVIG